MPKKGSPEKDEQMDWYDLRKFLIRLSRFSFLAGLSVLVVFIIGNFGYVLSMLIYRNYPELLPYILVFVGGFIVGGILYFINEIS